MDEYDLLGLTVEELASRAKEVHKFYCIGQWQNEIDFEFDITSDTYEDGIRQVAERLASPRHYATSVDYSVFYIIQLPIKDEDGIWRLVDFNSKDENTNHCHRYSSSFEISKHPAFIAKQKEIAELEKKKRHDEMRAAELRQREKELAIYEKVKRELEGK